MAQLSIEIASDNGALVDPDESDLVINEILGRVKATIYEVAGPSTAAAGAILDDNGNRIGKWSWKPGHTEFSDDD